MSLAASGTVEELIFLSGQQAEGSKQLYAFDLKFVRKTERDSIEH